MYGIGGPNGAFYSRGAGTVLALREACDAIAEGRATRALAGGADTALDPVTRAEFACVGTELDAGEGAALLALAKDGAVLIESVSTQVDTIPAADVAVGAGLDIDTAAALGETLAAGPALDWVVAAGLVRSGEARRAVAVSTGVDGVRCAVLFREATT